MSQKSESVTFSHTLTQSQIETLQQQIRQFKNLGKRYSESKIPKLVESNQSSTITQSIPKPVTKAAEPETAVPSLSWQCFNALLFFGPPKFPQDGSISFAPSDIGCFSKGAHLPLVVTRPYTSTIREKTISTFLSGNDSNSIASGENSSSNENSVHQSSFKLQRELRAQIVHQHQESMKSYPSSEINMIANPPVSHGANFLSELLPWRNHYRTKKQTRRDVKVFDKEEKKKRTEVDDRKKRKNNEYLKAVMAHRDDFLRFHKGKRSDCSKTARLVKVWVENLDAKKEKDEARAEMKRLQALKENDMEAYAALVQDTRNGRLKFLLNETDTYIATINKMIQDQRVEGLSSENDVVAIKNEDADAVNAIESELARDGKQGTGSVNRITQATKDYYRSTHRTVEVVAQPTLLKGGDLKEYQMSGLQWMVSLYNNNLNGILADEMGLGKTIQTIALLSYLMEFKHNNGPFLIVVPLSTLSNWVNEFNKWAPDILKVVYKGAPDERKRIFKDDVEAGHLNVLLTTYEYIMKDKSSLRKLCWQYIIVDEGHRMKNAQSKFAQTLGTVYQSKHRILLTGTPLQNNLPELWALLNFLLPTIFSSVDTFDQWFNKPFAAFRSQGPQANDDTNEVAVLSQEERMLIVHRLHEVLRPFMLRRVKDQVLDQLPEKVEKVLRCNLSGWQRKMYHSITMKGLASKDGSGGGLNNTIMQLRKVCNHPYLFIRDYIIDEDLVRCSGKFELLDRMLPKLKAAGHRVLMFSQMVELMNFLEQFFLYRGFKYLRLDGNTSSDEREKRMYMFNDPDSPYFIFLLSTRAGGLGLNLATADTVIIFDSDWNPMMDAQAQDRAHRIGQKNEVRVFRLITTSPIEERILSRANDKRNLTGLVVEAGKFNSKVTGDKAYNENKELMESMLKEWSQGGGGFVSEVGGDYDNNGEDGEDDLPDDEQINEMMASYGGEMELYQSMDAARYQKKAAQWASYHNVTNVSDAPPMPSRLMGANEKPGWLTNECWPPKYAVLMNDMMSLPQISKKKGRKKKIISVSGSSGGLHDEESSMFAANSTDGPLFEMAEESGSDDEDESAMNDDNASNDLHVVAGKNMRKRKDVLYDDHMTELQFSRFIEKQADQEAATNLMQAAAAASAKGKKAAAAAEEGAGSAVCKDLIKAIKDIQKIKRSDGVSFLCDLFVEKPPKAIYPDYYAIIEKPISLKDIMNNLRKPSYKYLEEVEMDFALMSANARTFNLDVSPVYQDCEQVRKEFYDRCVQVRAKYGMPASPFHKLPSVGHQIYESSKVYRCLLSNDTVSPDYVESSGKGNKRKSVDGESGTGSSKKAKKSIPGPYDNVAGGSGVDFNDYYLQSTIQYPTSSAPSDWNTPVYPNSSSSLSINLKRKSISATTNSTNAKTENSGSGGLVLSLNRKSIGNRLNNTGA